MSGVKLRGLFALTLGLVFLVGWLANTVYSEARYSGVQTPLEFINFTLNNSERPSSGDHTSLDKIMVYDEYAIINVSGLSLAQYEDTNSMDPTLDSECTGLEIVPRENDLDIGDIVAYRSSKINGLIVHRIVDIETDVNGEKYYILKGDNNSKPDPEHIYFDQIEQLLIGVLC